MPGSFRVYLAGKIFPEDDYFAEWRVKAESALITRGVIPMNPLLHKEVQQRDTKTFPAKDILMRDYGMVKSSDLVLANLRLKGYGTKPITEPIIGTFFEIAWAWDNQKPILAIADRDDSPFREHPFLIETVTHWFDNEDDALNNIFEYWDWRSK